MFGRRPWRFVQTSGLRASAQHFVHSVIGSSVPLAFIAQSISFVVLLVSRLIDFFSVLGGWLVCGWTRWYSRTPACAEEARLSGPGIV